MPQKKPEKLELKPYKFVVQAIVQQTDSEGRVISETAAEPVTIFGCQSLEDWAKDFPHKLKSAETEPKLQNNNG